MYKNDIADKQGNKMADCGQAYAQVNRNRNVIVISNFI